MQRLLIANAMALATLAANKGEEPAAKPEANAAPVLISKMTLKDMGANPKAILAEAEGSTKRHMCARIYGLATGTKEQRQTNENTGEVTIYEKLIGDFRGINLQTGARYKSAVLYLPSGIHEILSGPLDAAKLNNEAAEIAFGFDLFTKRATNKAGYSYGATILGEPEEVDAIKALEAEIEETAPLQLPAPAAPAA